MTACPGSFFMFQRVMLQGLGTSFPTCKLHLFTHLALESSNPGPSKSAAPFLSAVSSHAESPSGAAHCHLLLSRGLGGAQHDPKACLVPSVSMVVVSHVSPDEHPFHHRPAFLGLVPTSPKPAIVLYAPKRFSLLASHS